MNIPIVAGFLLALFGFTPSAGAEVPPEPKLREIALSNGIKLKYIEAGTGTPVIFIHGTTDDVYMWTPFVESFGADYHAIAYSRRYNHPNNNPIPPNANHSTEIEADDLADLITKLKLPKAHIVGYSFGAYTALHLALKHPQMVHSLVIAEPPLMPWLPNMPGDGGDGKRLFALHAKFENAARKVLKSNRGDKVEEAMRIFNDYAMDQDGFWDSLPNDIRRDCMRNSNELVALVTSKSMFGPLSRRQVASLKLPILIMAGTNTEGALKMISAELERLLPHAKRVDIPDATHGMWFDKPDECASAVTDFLSES